MNSATIDSATMRLLRVQALANAIGAACPSNTLLTDRPMLDTAIEQLALAIAEEAEAGMRELERLEVTSRRGNMRES
jgi:hypothetical protein